jgi:hypothetical protein
MEGKYGGGMMRFKLKCEKKRGATAVKYSPGASSNWRGNDWKWP